MTLIQTQNRLNLRLLSPSILENSSIIIIKIAILLPFHTHIIINIIILPPLISLIIINIISFPFIIHTVIDILILIRAKDTLLFWLLLLL